MAIGGIATILHGVIRLTRDIDLVVDLEPAQARSALGVLRPLGFTPTIPLPAEGFADPEQRRAWARRACLAVDRFIEYPMDFGGLWARPQVMQVGETSIRVASLHDLIQLERKAGRPQDLLDVERLEQVHRMGQE